MTTSIEKRNSLLLLAAIVFFASFHASAGSIHAADTPPNFIIMIGDDIGDGDIGAYGHASVRTPNIDQLAAAGLRFDRAFLTCSSCSPSRCSIMTGRYPHATGAGELHQPLPAGQVVFAGLLKQAGYYTASAGKWHLGNAARENFDTIVGGSPSGCENWVQVLRERPQDKPFFLWLAGVDAHRPYKANIIDKPHTADDAVVPPFLPDNPATRGDLALYYDEVTRFDDYVGRVMRELDRQQVAENTFVLVMSDNGRPFPRCKTTLYDSGVKTPLVVRWPAKVKAGAVCGELVSSVDIAPTLLELAGVAQAPTFQGKSFAPLLSEPAKPIREYVFTEHNWHDYQSHERGVRGKRFLYIRNAFSHLAGTPPADAVRSPTYVKMLELEDAGKLPPAQRGCFVTPRPVEELYDIETDPHSLNNLAAAPAHSDQLEKMRKALDQWISRTEDRVPQDPTPDKFHRTTGRPLAAQ